jgi:GDPmannose 4,6-dehydratase
MKTALVLGINGQDGSYIAEVLLARGYAVFGVGLQAQSRWVDSSHFRYLQLDAGDQTALGALLTEVRPNEIYHLAAVHGAAGYAYEPGWRAALALNVGSLHTCLEHLRLDDPRSRVFYASSLKAFGSHPPSLIDETTPRTSDCLYSITKNAANELIHYYRTEHGVWASIGYYFNHDSPRRPDNFFLPRLAAQIATQLGRRDSASPVATLDFWCDWGDSKEFMEITIDLLQTQQPHDVIIATGKPVYAVSLAAALSEALGLKFSHSCHFDAAPPFRADVRKLKAVVGKIPNRTAFDVAAWILRERYNIDVSGTKGSP